MISSFDSLDSLGEEEPEEEESIHPQIQELISSLVLFSFFWRKAAFREFETFEGFKRRKLKIFQEFFPEELKQGYFPACPTKELISSFPMVVICECGNVVGTGGFGVVKGCLECSGSKRLMTRFYYPIRNMPEATWIPTLWLDWAESVAIFLEQKRKKNTIQ